MKTAKQIRSTKYNFRSVPSKYQGILGQLPENAFFIVHGKPGQGKSYFCVGLASDLAAQGDKVLYLSLEEGYNATMQTKLNALNVTSPNLTIVDTEDAKDYTGKYGKFQFVVVDSGQKAGISENSIMELRKKYPHTAFFLVYQATKAGTHRGSLTESHEVDAVLKVEKGKVEVEKSRTGGSGDIEVEFSRTIGSTEDLGKIVDSGAVPGIDRADKKRLNTPPQILFKPNDKSVRSGNPISAAFLQKLGFITIGDSYFVEDETPDKIRDLYNIKGIEFGNWTSQEDRANYLLGILTSFYDLQKLLGFSTYQMGLGGKLSVCFGSRGVKGAIAYFQSNTYLINMNRHHRGDFDKETPTESRRKSYLEAMQFSGIQAFSHEYGHALDFFFPSEYKRSAAKNKGDYSNESTVSQKINLLIDKIADTAAYKRMENADKGKAQPYYANRTEIFARLFEKWVIVKMKDKGMKNAFMSKFKMELQADKTEDKTVGNKVYLTDSEFRAVEKDIDAIFALMRKTIPNAKPQNKVCRESKAIEKKAEVAIPKPTTPKRVNRISRKTPKNLKRKNVAPKPQSKAKVFAEWFPVAKIYTDEKRFQNREENYSSESVDKIIRDYDPNKLDPIKVWKDKDGKVYVVSGHSRLAAFKKMKLKEIPISFLQGSEAEIMRFGKREANYLATKEKLVEQIRAFKDNRDTDKYTQAKLKQVWGNDYTKYESWSYLNTKGKFLETLGTDAKVSFPYLEMRAQWVGALRKNYPQITNTHENEIFDFFYLSKAGKDIDKQTFFQKVESEVSRIDFDKEKPLYLEKSGNRGTAARSDTAEAQKRIFEIDKELTELRTKRNAARTKAEKDALEFEMKRLNEEKQRIEKNIKTVLKTQTALFGTKRKRQSKK